MLRSVLLVVKLHYERLDTAESSELFVDTTETLLLAFGT